jgi:flagellar protein FlaG
MDITGINGLGINPVSAPAQVAPDPVENRDVIQAVHALNAAQYFGDNNELSFLLDRQTRLPVIRIVNKKTKELVDQIPPEYILRLAEQFRQQGE